jgi:RNase P protein component
MHHQIEPGYDFVVIPRPRIQPEFQTTYDSLAALLQRLQRKLKKKRT